MAIYYKGNKITSVGVSTSGGSNKLEQAVFQYANFSSFPTTASTKAIYIDLSTKQAYYWNGASYILIENESNIDISNLVKLEGISYLPNEQGDEITFASASDDVTFTIENATNSYKLNGQTSDYYAKASDVKSLVKYVGLNQDDMNADELHIETFEGYSTDFYIINSQNAFKLGGQEPSHYLDYDNFTNTPNIPTKTSDLENDSKFVTEEQLDQLDLKNTIDYSVLVGYEATEETTLYELNDDGTLNKDKPLSEKVETIEAKEVTTFDIGDVVNIDTLSDNQIPTSKAVKHLIDIELGNIKKLLEVI